jgi:hypothetical protein
LWRQLVTSAAVILVAGIGIAAWYGFEWRAPEERAAEPVAQPVPMPTAAPAPQPVPVPMAGPVGETQGLSVPLRVDDELERFNRSVNASAANRGRERVPAR